MQAGGRDLRRTGIENVGALPWGAHFCLFYETPQDLIDAHAGYFAAGLEDGEFCIWALSDPITRDDAIASLRKSIRDFDRRIADGSFELISGYDWYPQGSEVDPLEITGKWHKKLADALAKGFTGMRVSGNAFWLVTNRWPAFRDYEKELDRSLNGQKIIVLCTYSLHASRAMDVLDVARTHNFSIARCNGRWEVLQTLERANAKLEIERLNHATSALSKAGPAQDLLTTQELVALGHVLRGLSSKEAARILGISHRTVEFHRANIVRKFGARNIPTLSAKCWGRTMTSNVCSTKEIRRAALSR